MLSFVVSQRRITAQAATSTGTGASRQSQLDVSVLKYFTMSIVYHLRTHLMFLRWFVTM